MNRFTSKTQKDIYIRTHTYTSSSHSGKGAQKPRLINRAYSIYSFLQQFDHRCMTIFGKEERVWPLDVAAIVQNGDITQTKKITFY